MGIDKIKSCNFAARKKNRGMLLGRLTVCD